MKQIFDVIVIGAGPAGATAARRCALIGLKTLLLEKEALPRYKACGSGVTRGALDLLDFSLAESLIEGDCSTFQLRYGRHQATVSRPYKVGIFTSRAQFDAFLTRKAVEAGAELYEGRRVTAVEVLASHAIVRCGPDTYVSKLVIGADGAYSVAARNVRPPFGRNQISVACDVNLGIDELLLEDPSAGIFEFGLMKYGYAWIFPRRDYVGVGIGARADKLQSHKETLRSVLLKWGVKSTDRECHWHVLPIGGVSRKTYTDRILLVGDAAGFVDPFFGEGISLAIRSGTHAAETARVALNHGDCTEAGLKSYGDSCEADFGHSLRSELRLTSIVHRYPNVLIKPFAMSAKLTDIAWNYSSSYFAHHTRSRIEPARK